MKDHLRDGLAMDCLPAVELGLSLRSRPLATRGRSGRGGADA